MRAITRLDPMSREEMKERLKTQPATGHVRGGRILTLDFLKARTEVDPETNCWIWQRGYSGGYARVAGRSPITGEWVSTHLAHRIGYECVYGEIPDGMFVLHSCHRALCVNPSHLRVGDHQDNMDDKVASGRQPTVLSQADVIEIRERAYSEDILHKQLGVEYGVNRSTISTIVRGERWTHLLPEGFKPKSNRPKKLTADEVLEIRERYAAGGISQERLGVEYGVSRQHIGKIVRGERRTRLYV